MAHAAKSQDATSMEWEPIAAGGYTRARKWRVTLDDGTRVFAKEASASEIAVFGAVDASFLPRVHAVRDGILLLEDLSEAHWPPPYPDDTSPLLAALEEVAATPPPAQLPRLTDGSRWQAIASEPWPLLALGLCSGDWLDRSLPGLIEAEARVPVSGDGLVHYDVWAGNLCFADRAPFSSTGRWRTSATRASTLPSPCCRSSSRERAPRLSTTSPRSLPMSRALSRRRLGCHRRDGQPREPTSAQTRRAISRSPYRGSRNRSAARSASASVGRCVFARGIVANTDASHT
jgi:hypothetical protein